LTKRRGQGFFEKVDRYTKRKPESAMSVSIVIPTGLEDCPPEIKSTKTYAERYGVGRSCAKAV